jgi:queuine tRNA-ribosyltransferase
MGYNEAALERTRLGRYKSAQPATIRFRIVHGGIFPDLRQESARKLRELDFPGYAVGGLSVGETKEQMYAILDQVVLFSGGSPPI